MAERQKHSSDEVIKVSRILLSNSVFTIFHCVHVSAYKKRDSIFQCWLIIFYDFSPIHHSENDTDTQRHAGIAGVFTFYLRIFSDIFFLVIRRKEPCIPFYFRVSFEPDKIYSPNQNIRVECLRIHFTFSMKCYLTRPKWRERNIRWDFWTPM